MVFTIPNVAKNIGTSHRATARLIGSIGNLLSCSMIFYLGNVSRKFMNVWPLRRP